jgi:UDP-N-acetylglucosamine 2-epimerase (non-hydrolysing)
VTVTEGTNQIVGNDPERIARETLGLLDGKNKVGHTPELWDGQAAKRIVEVVKGQEI